MCGNSQPIAFAFGLPVVVDGHGAVPSTGVLAGDLRIDFPFSLSGWSFMADQVGSAKLDVWVRPWVAGSPPTILNSIVAAAPPNIVAAGSASNATLVGWTKTFGAGPWWLRWHLDTIAVINFFTFQLQARRTIGV